MTDGQRFVPYLFLTAVIFAVYGNIYDNTFLFDDNLLIELNTYLRSWDTFGKLFTASTTDGAHIAGGFYRPVQNFLYFFVYQLGGENPSGFHLLNVLLHTADACLAYRLALRLGIDARAALFGCLIWGLHPLHTEAVTYMSGTADPLFVFFSLLGLNLLMPEPTTKTIWLSLPLFALAILSKEIAVIFPALVVVCLYYVNQGKLSPRPYIKTWPLWLGTFAYLAWRVLSTDYDGPERYQQMINFPEFATFRYYINDPFVRICTFLATLPAYALLIVWPVGLHMERMFPIYNDPANTQVLLGFAMVCAALAHIILRRRSAAARALNWGLLWFGTAYIPCTGIVFPMNSLFLEHWMYWPTLGLFIGICQSIALSLAAIHRRALTNATLGLGVIAVAALSARTFDQNLVWRNPIVFYNHIFSFGVISARAHNNLAIAYMGENNIPKAIEEYHRAIKEGDTYAETHYNLAVLLAQLPDFPSHRGEILKELLRSIEIQPGFYRSYNALAKIYADMGDKASAQYYAQKAAALKQ